MVKWLVVLLVERYGKLGTPTANKTFDVEFEKEINAWAEANVDASEREDSDSEGLRRDDVRGRRNAYRDGYVVQMDMGKCART